LSIELEQASVTINASNNGDVGVVNICEVTKESSKSLLEGENSKTKSYRAYCFNRNGNINKYHLDKLNLTEVTYE